VLGYYESSLAALVDAIEPFATGLKRGDASSPGNRELLRYVGDTLLTQHKRVGAGEWVRGEFTVRPAPARR